MTDTIDDLATMGWSPADLLTELRQQSVRFLSELPSRPRALRLRAGTVAVDLEWDAAPTAADRTDPAVPAAGRAPHPRAAPEAVGVADAGEEPGVPGGLHVTSPAVGVYYAASEPGAAPFVRIGDTVTAGQQVAIIEVMKLFVPVTAESAGRVSAVLKGDGDAVEYGEPLITLEPAGDV